MNATAGSDAPVQRLVPWVARYTTDEYIAFLNTHSDKRMLPDEQRAALFDAIRASLDDGRRRDRAPVRGGVGGRASVLDR